MAAALQDLLDIFGNLRRERHYPILAPSEVQRRLSARLLLGALSPLACLPLGAPGVSACLLLGAFCLGACSLLGAFSRLFGACGAFSRLFGARGFRQRGKPLPRLRL